MWIPRHENDGLDDSRYHYRVPVHREIVRKPLDGHMSIRKPAFIVAAATGTILVLAVLFVILRQNIVMRATGSPSRGVSVLFIGNSFIFTNDLPKTLADVAASLGDGVAYDQAAPGGYLLMQHAKDPETLKKIQSRKWDYVVLQAQSEEPAFPDQQLDQLVLPNAVELDRQIHEANAATRTLFFGTWGYKDGDSRNCPAFPEICDYRGMQTRLNQGYQLMAEKTGGGLIPVGEAWNRVLQERPEIELYGDDGIHPSLEGTYLAACVFYVSIFRKPVIGADSGGINPIHAGWLQEIAQQTVLGPAPVKP